MNVKLSECFRPVCLCNFFQLPLSHNGFLDENDAAFGVIFRWGEERS